MDWILPATLSWVNMLLNREPCLGRVPLLRQQCLVQVVGIWCRWGGSQLPYTLDQWRADYDEWINYDDSNWDNDFLTWMADPEPYGGVNFLNDVKSKRTALGVGLQSGSQVDNLEPILGLAPNLNRLIIGNVNLSNIDQIAGLDSLNQLDLEGHNISDIKPIAGLQLLTWLNIQSNEISDLSALENLSGLNKLLLQGNDISDLSPLSNLTNLRELYLDFNNISDLSPLKNLTGLQKLFLDANPITQSQKDMLEAALPTTSITWPSTILPDPEEPEAPTTTTTTTGYPSLDQFTTEDFTDFTQSVASAMAEVGSHQSRLNMEVQHNETARVNLEAAKSRIMDADMAQESTRFAKTNVLVQSSASMVAQANQLSDIALRLMVNR